MITGAFFNRLNGQVDYIDPGPGPAAGPPSGVWINTLLDSSNYLLTKVHANKAYPGKWIVTNVTGRPRRMPRFVQRRRDLQQRQANQRAGSTCSRSATRATAIRRCRTSQATISTGCSTVRSPRATASTAPTSRRAHGYHNKIFAPQTIIGTASNGNFVARATLAGNGESTSPGTGSGTVVFNSTTDTLTVTLTFTGLELLPITPPGVPGPAHIHFGSIVPGGPILFPFVEPYANNFPLGVTSGTYTTTLTAASFLPDPANGINTFAQAVKAIEAGHTYFNIHTVMFPMGEIAGQIVVAGAVGGPPVGAVHSGVFSPVVPVGGTPCSVPT